MSESSQKLAKNIGTWITNQKNRLHKSIKKDPNTVYGLIAIFLVALFLRTWNYWDRIYFYADNALFVQAAYFANQNLKIPQIGPFAQAPFFTGPWWLWILQIVFIIPLGVLTPWYFMTLLSLVFIWLMYWVGREIGGKGLGLLVAALTAVSTAQVDNSFMTWNAAADPFFGLLGIIFLLQYLKTKKWLYVFLLGFCVSVGTTIHFQTALIAPLILIAVFGVKPKIKNFLALALGILIPLIPFIYFDLRFNWFETRRILDYLLIGQHRIYVPNRWLTYAGVFWPATWAWTIGGVPWMGYVITGLIALISLFNLKNIRKYWKIYVILLSFTISIVMFRYYRGERLFYYTNFAHAFVLLLTAWMIYEIYKFKKILGIALASVVLFFTVQSSLANFAPRAITYPQVKNMVAEMYQKYPGQQIDIYECPFSGSMISTPVSYQMYFDGKNSLDGVKIGVCNHELNLTWREVEQFEIDREYGFLNKSTPHIYTDMTEWWIAKPPLTLW